MSDRIRYGLIARGSEDLLTLDGKVSNQKLVRDDVVFRPSNDRDQALRNAIRRIEADRHRETEKHEDDICA